MSGPEREKEFERMAAETGPRGLGIALTLLKSREAAQDAVQEAFEKAYRSLSGFRGEARMGTWFLRILINTANKKIRLERRLRPLSMSKPDEPGQEEEAFHLPSQERDLHSAQLRERLAEAVTSLPVRQRTAFVLRYVHGMSTDETAEVMECAPGTVKATLYKAVARLRGLLVDLWEEESR